MREISIITINYNNCVGLKKTLNSVFAQTYQNFEYIIIDGGSTDGSRQVIEFNEKKFSFWVSEKDDGIYHALNKGIKKASGDYLIFLNSGDFFLDNHFLSTLSKMISNEPADIYYGNIEMIDKNKKKYYQTFSPNLDLYFWEHNTLNHQACIIRSSLFIEDGNYDTKFTLAADYAFFLKAFFKGKKFQYVDQNIVHYDLKGISTLRNVEYIMEMKEIWKQTLPKFISDIYEKNRSYELLMEHKIMLLAKNLNKKYIQIRRFLKLQ